MTYGAHVLLSSTDAGADRLFLRDVLGFPAVDAGDGWLILALPHAEVGVHPDDRDATRTHAGHHLLAGVMYLMCHDVAAAVAELTAKGVNCPAPAQEGWGIVTSVPLPSGGALGLYQPLHPTALVT